MFQKVSLFLITLFTAQLIAGSNAPTLIKKIVPFQEWPTLTSNVVGLLSQNNIEGINTINWTRRVAQAGSTKFAENTYLFNFDNKSPYVVYFPSTGEGYNFMKNWKGIEEFRPAGIDAAEFYPTTLNKWGLNKAVHLIDAQVNNGRGSKYQSVHFIISDLKILDKSNLYPIDPNQVVTSYLSQFKKGGAVAQKFDTELAKGIAVEKANSPIYNNVKDRDYKNTIYDGYSATWLANEKVLKITYYRRMVDSYSKTVIVKPRPINKKQPPPPDMKETYTAVFAAEIAEVVEYDKDGKLRSPAKLYPVETYSSERPQHQ